LASDALQLSL